MIAEAVTKDQPPPPQLETGLEWLVTSHTPWGYVEMAHYMNGDEGFLDWGCAVLKPSLLLQWVLAVWCTSTFNSSKLILCLNIQTANLEITSWLSLILKLCNLLNSKVQWGCRFALYHIAFFCFFFYQASSLFPKTHFIWMFYYVLNNAKKTSYLLLNRGNHGSFCCFVCFWYRSKIQPMQNTCMGFPK